MGELSVNLKVDVDRSESHDRFVQSETLIVRVAEGDEVAFRQLIDAHGESIARLIGRLMGWHTDCDDILQDVFLQVWQRAESFKNSGPVEGWLKRIAVNRCRNHFRTLMRFRRRLERFVSLVLVNKDQQYESSFPSDGEHDELHAAIQSLPNDDRMILVLFYLEEMDGQDVAESLGLKHGTLHVRLHRARQKLKKRLDEMQTDG